MQYGGEAMYTIGIDVGTTGTKAYVLDDEGAVCGQGYQAYGLDFQNGGYVGQNPADWWDACVTSVRQATRSLWEPSVIRAISVSTQGGSTFVADAHGNPLMDAMTWMDARALKQIKALRAAFKDDELYHKTGWRLNVSMDAAKYLWLKQNSGELIKKGNCFVSTLEYINHKLVGKYVIDPTNAAMRQLMNINTLKWDEDILAYLGLDADFLPEIAASGSCLGNLKKHAADALGLSQHVKVYNGAHDQYCAAVGVGATHKGDLLLSTGTAWVVLGITDELMFTDSFVAAGRHVVPQMYGALATLPVAGAALDWFKKGFGIDSYEQINALCKERSANTQDLYFYPYFNGVTFPLWQYDAKASLVGLSLEHNRFDVAHAVMEGVAFQMRMVLDDYRENGFNASKISVMGGALKSDLWMSLIVNITGCRINKVKIPDTACVGAAVLAGVMDGLYPDFDTIIDQISPLEPAEIIGDELDFYQEKYNSYRRHWKTIAPIYEKEDGNPSKAE